MSAAKFCWLSILGLALAMRGSPCRAEDFSLTDVQAYYTTRAKADPGDGTGTRNEDLAVLRAEHYGTWAYGNNYIDLDLFMGTQVGGKGAGAGGGDASHQFFFTYQPRLSLGALFGSGTGTGLVKDVFAVYRMERGSYGDFRADNFGLSLDVAVPGTAFFEQDFLARSTNFDRSTKFLSRTVWLAPFDVHGLGVHFDALVLIKSTDASGTDVFAQPDLLFDLLPKGRLQLGTRLEYHSARAYSRFTPYVLLKWIF